ncbi:MAG: hypothetical protein E7659_02005 [Ruminococcaceae bacterium]|nr:hypothetical protein [Oscillospiraceae bacterium]
MTIQNLTRLLAVVLTMATMLSFVACGPSGGNDGSLKLESFIIDPTSIKTEYVIGEKVDFSGIKATAKYNDENLNKTYTFAELTISNTDGITDTVGEKEITVSFMDPNLGVKQEAKIKIKVVKSTPDQTTPDDPNQPSTPEEPTLEIIGFDTPSTLVAFNAANKNAGKLNYGEAGFSGQFAVGNQIYVIGNQNEFKLTPTVEILNIETDEEETAKEFFAEVVISLKKNGEYVALTAQKKEGNVVEYYDGDLLIATVNTYKGTYQFSADAANAEVKISVAPSTKQYIVYEEDFPPIVLEAKVINAYNVYEAWQLAVVDNYNEEWADHKATHGLTNVVANGIVLHNDIHLSAADVPASFFHTTTADVVYYKLDENGELVPAKTIPAGTKYLVDWTFIYEHRGAGSFVMEGNMFTLDTKGFPIIPSPGVFGKDAGKDYEEDFSNAALFRFLVAEEAAEEVVNVTLNNMALIGNAARDNLVDSTESLASAGGLIFFKSCEGAQVTMNNIIGNSYFITYFTENTTTLKVTNSKCFDSYQNAAFVWGDSTFELIDSYVNGCGGPAIIAQSVWEENHHPIVNVTGGVLETHLGGQEIWFTAVGANTIVGQIKALGYGLQAGGLGNFVDAKGQMNIKGAIMANGDNATEIVTGIGAQGSILIDGEGINRFQTEDNVNWLTILKISQGAIQTTGATPPFFTVYGADGTAYTLYSDGENLFDFAGNLFGTDPSHQAIAAAFMQADTIVLTQGGLSVVFEYYHY